MELIKATNELVIASHPYPGFPVLLWSTMESCIPVNSFLRYYLLRGSIGSKRSWESTGRALYDYFSFLEAHDLEWEDVSRGEEKTLIAAYRDYCFQSVGLARNTVRQRLLYICKYYEYSMSKGWIESLPFRIEERPLPLGRREVMYAPGAGAKTMTPDVMPRKHKNLPKFLSKGQVETLLAAATNPHHKLLIQFALKTGLRREEIATFPFDRVFNPIEKKERNLPIKLDPAAGGGQRTKGSKARDIWISRKLMEDLYFYAVHLRGERASLSKTPHRNLFLNVNGEPYANDGKSIARIVKDIGRKAGLEVHPHMLRHTYATHTLMALQTRRGDTRIEPLVFLQRQLGHASIQTTVIYLHLINELADEAVLEYNDDLNEGES